MKRGGTPLMTTSCGTWLGNRSEKGSPIQTDESGCKLQKDVQAEAPSHWSEEEARVDPCSLTKFLHCLAAALKFRGI